MRGWLKKTTQLTVNAVVTKQGGFFSFTAKCNLNPLMSVNLEGLSPRAVGAALRAVARALGE